MRPAQRRAHPRHGQARPLRQLGRVDPRFPGEQDRHQLGVLRGLLRGQRLQDAARRHRAYCALCATGQECVESSAMDELLEAALAVQSAGLQGGAR